MKIDEMYKFSLFLIPIVWVVGITTSLILYFSLNVDIRMIWLRSYIIGLASGLLCYGITVRTNRLLSKNPEENKNFRKITVFSYLLRLVFLGVIFAAIIFTDGLDPIPALIGYGTLKIVMIILVLVRKGAHGKE